MKQMSYEDWLQYFDQIQICNISPDTLRNSRSQGLRWNCLQFDGEWVNGRTSGGAGLGADKQRFWMNVQNQVYIQDI